MVVGYVAGTCAHVHGAATSPLCGLLLGFDDMNKIIVFAISVICRQMRVVAPTTCTFSCHTAFVASSLHHVDD